MKRRKQANKAVACKRSRRRFSGKAAPLRPEERSEPEIVKGTSRRVVVVRPEPETLFEQIIYIVRDDALAQPGVSEKEVLRQAANAVQPRMKRVPHPTRRRSRLTAALLWLSGVALTLAVGIGVYWYLMG